MSFSHLYNGLDSDNSALRARTGKVVDCDGLVSLMCTLESCVVTVLTVKREMH